VRHERRYPATAGSVDPKGAALVLVLRGADHRPGLSAVLPAVLALDTVGCCAAIRATLVCE